MNRLTAATSSALFGFALLAACSSSSRSAEPEAAQPVVPGEAPPDANCKTPAPLPEGAWFTDITAESGLVDVEGIRIVAADVDGDGLPDLLVHGGVSARDSLAAPKKRLFINKGAGRFEETTAASGLLDSRDGPGTCLKTAGQAQAALTSVGAAPRLLRLRVRR